MMDLIDRQQALKAVAWDSEAYSAINNLPSAEKTGKWIESTESRFRPFMCSACGCIYDVDTVMGKPVWNFCPKCGSENREVE